MATNANSVDFIQTNPVYIDDTTALVLNEFQDKQIYMAIINLVAKTQQQFEALLVNIAEQRRLPIAIGEQLTEIGRQVGVQRTVEDDNDFRSAIYLASIKRRADGTRDSIAQALYVSTGFYPLLYSGLYRQVDIGLKGEILPSYETIQEILGILPLNTAYRIIKLPRTGSPFGFANNANAKGFGSRSQVGGDVGGMSSLRAALPIPKQRTTNKLPYVQVGYVDAGYVEPI
jgi:hypothetical protein